MGKLVLKELLTASYLGSNRLVPFYYQPTLGGTDIEGVDTLRGLVDYRLRASNRILLQSGVLPQPSGAPLVFTASMILARLP
jgi:hypothetical protein